MAWGYIFLSPWLIGVAVLVIWPLGRSLLLSFQVVTDLVGLQSEWVGLANFKAVFTKDVLFLPALLRTMINVVTNVPLILVFSLSMSLLVAQVERGQTLVRAVFFLPVIIGSAGVITELINMGAGREVMSTTLDALETALVSTPGTQGAAIMTPIQTVLNRLTLIIWHTGVQILLFVAGLNSIPESLYEAAQVDGCTAWESFWKITLPMLSPVILVAGIFTLVDMLTDPMNEVINYIGNVGIVQLRFGLGSALGLLYFVVVFLVIMLFTGAASRSVFYAGERQ